MNNKGDTYSIKKQRHLSPKVDTCGYVRIRMFVPARYDKQKIKEFPRSRLVCTLWNGKPPRKNSQVNHIDLDKFNDHYTNLEWQSAAQNSHHRLANGGGLRKSYAESKRILDSLPKPQDFPAHTPNF